MTKDDVLKEGEEEEEDISEDYCFTCKDGGRLRLCDFSKCTKAYHPHCVDKDTTFLDDDNHWTCSLHTCNCGRRSTFQCFCCPISYCRSCFRSAEFGQVKKKTKGFCIDCLNVALMIEEDRQIDSDGEEVDFNNRETYECLFKEYWEIIKFREGLTLQHLQIANKHLKRGKMIKIESDSEKLIDEGSMLGDLGSDDLEDDFDDIDSLPKGFRGKRRRMKNRTKKLRKERTFIGWASEELIRFLASIGKDTTRSLHRLDVTEIVKEYIQSKNLLHPNKKKRNHVIPDERLQYLFNKKKLKYHQISDLVRGHLADEQSDQDDELPLGLEEYEGVSAGKKQRKTHSGFKTPWSAFKNSNSAESKTLTSKLTCYTEKVPGPSKSSYAAIVTCNIKLAYLKRSLVLDLMKNPETFEDKIVGCFVRVKNDPKDICYSGEKVYQLGLVKGIKRAEQSYKIGEINTDIVLCISNFLRDIDISMLSDDDIEEVECQDLRQLVKEGLFKQPTVAELESKIRSVHKDIINHWIDREISKLQKQIDRANEKGWRKELNEYIDKRELLCTPKERMRLLEEIPEIIADIEGDIDANLNEPLNLHIVNKGVAGNVAPHDKKVAERTAEGTHTSGAEDVREEVEGKFLPSCKRTAEKQGNFRSSCKQTVEKQGNFRSSSKQTAKKQGNFHSSYKQTAEKQGNFRSSCKQTAEKQGKLLSSCKRTAEKQGIKDLGSIAGRILRNRRLTNRIMEKSTEPSEIPMIDLDEDDGNDFTGFQTTNGIVTVNACNESNKAIWHYEDHLGNKQGPFTLTSLSCWKEDGFVGDNVKVWRSGQNKADAILLTIALASAIPGLGKYEQKRPDQMPNTEFLCQLDEHKQSYMEKKESYN